MRLEGIHGGDVHDPAPASRGHVFDRRDHHVVGAYDIDGEIGVPVFTADLEYRLVCVDAGIVDETVDGSEDLHGLREGRFGDVQVGDVTFNRCSSTAKFLDLGCNPLRRMQSAIEKCDGVASCNSGRRLTAGKCPYALQLGKA